MCRITLVFLWIGLRSVQLCYADSINLVSEKSKAEIVIRHGATPTEKYAAAELQRVIKLMTGSELPVIQSKINPKRSQIFIGTPSMGPDFKFLHDAISIKASDGEELVLVRTHRNVLYISGSNPSAVLYATYTFLQDYLDVRWFWPGESGEFIPKRRNIAVDEINLVQKPDLKVRSLAITGIRYGDPDTDTWMARNRMNVVSHSPDSGKNPNLQIRREKGFQIRIAGHNVVFPAATLKEHPEYLAQVGGKRVPHPKGASQLCWSNVAVQDEVAAMIGRWWDQSPYPDVVHFYPADQPQYCECSDCRALGDVTTRWQIFSAAVINKLEKTHPGKRYWTYAYLQYKVVPATVAPFEFIPYTLYDVSYRHLLSSGSKFHDVSIREMDGWQKKAVTLGIRGYEYIIFDKPMYVPMVSWVTDQMAFLKKRNITGYMSELPPYGSPRRAAPERTYWNTNRMALYAAGKAMWNTEVKAADIVADWCSKVYGPAATHMEDYYWETEKLWRASPKNISVYTNSAVNHIDDFLPAESYPNLYQYFNKALSSIETLPSDRRERIQKQIMLEQKMLDSWYKVYLMKEGLASNYELGLVKSVSENPVLQNITLYGPGAESSRSVSAGWDGKHIYFRTPLPENKQTAPLLEFLIQPDPLSPDLRRMVLGLDGKIQYSKSYDGLDYVNTEMEMPPVRTVKINGQSYSEVKIPLTNVGISPEGTTFMLGINMRKNRTVLAGWPALNASSLYSLGNVQLYHEAPETPPSLVLYDNGGNSSPLSIDLQERGWKVTKSPLNFKDLSNRKTHGRPVILYRFTGEVKIPEDEIKNLHQFVNEGGLLILAGTGEIPVDQWFPEVPPVKWIPDQASRPRRASKFETGEWLTGMNNISKVLQTGLGPLSAYKPVKTGWDEKAMIKLINGEDVPFLLSKSIGKGTLVLTSSPMGYYGGYDMFGSRNTMNVAMMIENFYNETRSKYSMQVK
ncbi:MAG TPA: DUF4838 domain-containing protein [Sphingobacteriaceae bacterium]